MSIKIAFEPSYYSEYSRKTLVQRIFDNICWVLKYHRANTFYCLYGMDIKGVRGKEYIDEKGFWKGLNKLNYNKGNNSQVCLLRDKYLFYKYMSACNIPVPEVFAVIKNGRYYDANLNEVDASLLVEEKGYFIKDIEGECASFVKKIDDYDSLQIFKNQLQNGTYICQRALKQHGTMKKLNADAINTLRIVTVHNDGKISILSSLLRVGTSATGNVDNWATGGLAVGIREDGYLKEFGFYKPGHGLKVSIHPDSKLKFNEFKVPMLQEAYDLACKAHEKIYNVGAIGWDIAISESGPVIIEGNDNFEIALMQACDKPLKKQWLDLY